MKTVKNDMVRLYKVQRIYFYYLYIKGIAALNITYHGITTVNFDKKIIKSDKGLVYYIILK